MKFALKYEWHIIKSYDGLTTDFNLNAKNKLYTLSNTRFKIYWVFWYNLEQYILLNRQSKVSGGGDN